MHKILSFIWSRIYLLVASFIFDNFITVFFIYYLGIFFPLIIVTDNIASFVYMSATFFSYFSSLEAYWTFFFNVVASYFASNYILYRLGLAFLIKSENTSESSTHTITLATYHRDPASILLFEHPCLTMYYLITSYFLFLSNIPSLVHPFIFHREFCNYGKLVLSFFIVHSLPYIVV